MDADYFTGFPPVWSALERLKEYRRRQDAEIAEWKRNEARLEAQRAAELTVELEHQRLKAEDDRERAKCSEIRAKIRRGEKLTKSEAFYYGHSHYGSAAGCHCGSR